MLLTVITINHKEIELLMYRCQSIARSNGILFRYMSNQTIEAVYSRCTTLFKNSEFNSIVKVFMRYTINHVISNKREWNNCFFKFIQLSEPFDTKK